jgi:RING finger protein 170
MIHFLRTPEGMNFFFISIMRSKWILFMMLYIISPFDLIPEAIFGIIGFIDDLFMVVVVIFVISNIFYNFLRLRDANRNRQR